MTPSPALPRHGGDLDALARRAGCAPDQLLDFSANLNPLGPPPGLREAVFAAWPAIQHYPSPRAESLVADLARRHGVAPSRVVAGNGSTEILYALARVAARRMGCRRALLCPPCYGDYARAARLAGLPVASCPRDPGDGFRLDLQRLDAAARPGDWIVVGRPNNPDGSAPPTGAWTTFARSRPDVAVLVDEAFADFLDDGADVAGSATGTDNLSALRSLTKFYALPGMRLGYGVLPPAWAEALRDELPPWTVGALETAAAKHCLAATDYAGQTRRAVADGRAALSAGLTELPGMTVFPGTANYLLARLDASGNPDAFDAHALAEAMLLKHRIALRVFHGPDDPDRRHFRVAVRTPAENARLLAALSGELA